MTKDEANTIYYQVASAASEANLWKLPGVNWQFTSEQLEPGLIANKVSISITHAGFEIFNDQIQCKSQDLERITYKFYREAKEAYFAVTLLGDIDKFTEAKALR